jgi:hypothetical protein
MSERGDRGNGGGQVTASVPVGIARSVVEGLKGQPILFGIIVLNIAWGLYLWRADERRAEGTRLLFTELMKLCAVRPER